MPISTRLTGTSTQLVNGSFDENTSITPATFRTTSTAVYASALDEVTNMIITNGLVYISQDLFWDVIAIV